MAADYSTELVGCAERNLAASPITIDRGIRDRTSNEFTDFGMRLEALSAIYVNSCERSAANFADKIVLQFLRAISKIPNAELVRVLRALQGDVFRAWQWRRTENNFAVLGQLDNPDDTDGWSLLRDALDLVETTPKYREEIKEQFEEFLDGSITAAYDAIDEANEGYNVDLPLDELMQLDDLADRWGIPSSDIDYLAEEIREIQDRRDAADAEQGRRERSQNQPTLMEATEAEPRRGDAIFDHL